MGTWAVWDLETLRLAAEVPGGWGAIRKFGMSVGVVVDETGEPRSFGEGDGANLADFLLTKDVIVGFNSIRFDVKVLAGYVPGTVVNALRDRSLDLLWSLDRITGRRSCVTLDKAAHATLGMQKSLEGGGVEAVQLWRTGDPDNRAKVVDYCLQDVRMTHGLWMHGIEHGHVFAPLRARRGEPAQLRARINVPWQLP